MHHSSNVSRSFEDDQLRSAIFRVGHHGRVLVVLGSCFRLPETPATTDGLTPEYIRLQWGKEGISVSGETI